MSAYASAGSRTIDDSRGTIAIAATAAGICFVLALHYALPEFWAKILLDRGGLIYPFSVQVGMWLAFSVGLGEILARYLTARAEMQQLDRRYLPEDVETVLQAEDLKDIYRNLHQSPDLRRRFLPRLIDRCIQQFQASLSIGNAASLLNTSVEMFIHEVDLRYSMLRYLCWVIPSLGFIGTVIGIGHALSIAGQPGRSQDPNLLNEVTRGLAVSFDGTLVALLLASILLFLQMIVQSKEEHALNLSGQYCLDNLINRLYVPKRA